MLRYPDRDEVRITDAPLIDGNVVVIAGKRWTVIHTEAPDPGNAAVRFFCRPESGATPNG